MGIRQRGFTLIELLVVIFIIGLLTGILLPNFVGIRKRARDSRRIQDMKEIQKAFEEYYLANNTYTNCATMASDFLEGGQLPDDPLNSGDYVYTGDCRNYGYYYCAKLEIRSGNAGAVGNCNDSTRECTFSSGSDNEYYCVKNRQ